MMQLISIIGFVLFMLTLSIFIVNLIIIFPKVRGKENISINDFAIGFQYLSYLIEYRHICLKEGLSLFWFYYEVTVYVIIVILSLLFIFLNAASDILMGTPNMLCAQYEIGGQYIYLLSAGGTGSKDDSQYQYVILKF